MARCTTNGLVDPRPQPSPPDITHDATHDVRRYAGKVDLDEVLVADWRRVDDLTHAVTVRWPRHHAFYTPTPHDYTVLLFTESVRQALAVTSHLGLDIPVGHRMGWELLSCTVAPDCLAIDTDPTDLELTVTHDPFTRRRSGLARLTARVTATRGGRLLGTALIHYTAYPPALYDRLRGEHADAREAFARALPPGPATDPALVGRTDPQDVVLAEDTTHTGNDSRRRWALRADTTHPVLFDHPHDHIPGMVLLEAASQAAQAVAAPRRVVPIELDTTFSRYVEFDEPCTIVAEEPEVDALGRLRQVVSGVQCGETVFSTRVTGIFPDPVFIPRQRKHVAVRD
ncbi:ScbA/BarX family gamma-butyrolactone biosynthesis protein [Streptomyces sp. NPDC085481]|uniref:ScbA/BarX family gamma-butyrolactone biosynthesis protein n=1 Tax=Streptomyces sp. NPDC085481 TaxID=3365727 RepID=UPI0037D233E0